MPLFETKRLSAARDAVAPDGSDVRLLLQLNRGSMAHFELPAGQTSKAVRHRTVDEIWFFLSGRGEMWRRQKGEAESVVPVEPGTCLTIPVGTEFQFRSLSDEPLSAVGVTMPPWPGEHEAIVGAGKWEATVR
jgi:mannose-6-phosphate isomerase-like protein (cupin superfamily)